MAASKRCPTCSETKAAEEFGRNRARRDGLQSQCKSCRFATEAARDFERRRTDPVFREKMRVKAQRATQRSALRHPSRGQARQAERQIVGSAEWARALVLKARQRGDLVKPPSCEQCGATPPQHQLHGHHWHGDYANRPLEVRWLCTLCHGAEHSTRASDGWPASKTSSADPINASAPIESGHHRRAAEAQSSRVHASSPTQTGRDGRGSAPSLVR